MSENGSDLQQENQRLLNENKFLQGRIRGYTTLGDLLQEKRALCAELERQVEALRSKLDTTQLATSPPASLPAQAPSPGAVEDPQPSSSAQQQVSLPAAAATLTTAMSDPAHLTDLHNPADDALFSGPEETAAPASAKGASIMQESMTEAQLPEQKDEDETVVIRTPPASSSSLQGSLVAPSPSPQPHSAFTTSSESMVTGLGSVRTFSTLSSMGSYHVVLQQGLTMSETSLTRPEQTTADLDVELGNLMSASSPEDFSRLADHLKTMSQDIMKLGQDKEKYKSYIDMMNKENRHLKTQLAQSKEENQRLLRRIKKLEHERDNFPASESLSPSHEWVRVEKTQKSAEEAGSSESPGALDAAALQAKVRSLESTNKKLLAANQEWQEKWSGLEEQAKASQAALARQLEEARQEAAGLQEGRSQLEDMLMQAKSRASELEAQLEEKAEELESCNARMRSLEERYNATQQQLSALGRENTSYRTELEVLQTKRPGKAVPSKTVEELKTDNIVLRQQLKVFEEDFERERQDRAQAQASCDDLKTQLDVLRREKSDLSRKVRSLTDDVRNKDTQVRHAQQQIIKLQGKVKQLSAQLKEATPRYSVPYPVTQVYAPPHLYMGAQAPYPAYPGVMAGGVVSRPPTLASGDLTAQHSPERLHGSWTCLSCTYVNFPGRVICEMCGTDNTTQLRRGHSELAAQGNAAHAALMSRSPHAPGQRNELPSSAQPDLVCDAMEM